MKFLAKPGNLFYFNSNFIKFVMIFKNYKFYIIYKHMTI